MESVSEDFSIPQVTLEVGLTNYSLFPEKTNPSFYHPIFETLAFHPPQA